MKSHCYLILQLLVQPDGSLISAKGLEYDGPDLNYQSAGIVLLSAIYEPFTLDGETLNNPIFNPNGPYPNHCQVHFPDTTHRIRYGHLYIGTRQ